MTCQCTLPDGAVKLFCERHQCVKYRRKVELCNLGAQGEPFARDYWKAWEEGRGPGQVEIKPRVPSAPSYGPGTELTAIIHELKLSEGCGSCSGKASQMNEWGVQGCRDNFETIVGWLRESEKKPGWKAKVKAAAIAFATGLAFKVNWSDPLPDLITEAIRRAEENHY